MSESSTSVSSQQCLLKNKHKAENLTQILQMRKERNLVYFREADYLDQNQKDIIETIKDSTKLILTMKNCLNTRAHTFGSTC